MHFCFVVVSAHDDLLDLEAEDHESFCDFSDIGVDCFFKEFPIIGEFRFEFVVLSECFGFGGRGLIGLLLWGEFEIANVGEVYFE